MASKIDAHETRGGGGVSSAAPPKPAEAPQAPPAKPGHVPGARPFEHWVKEAGTKSTDALIARRAMGWPIGRLVTRESFDAAIIAGRDLPIR